MNWTVTQDGEEFVVTQDGEERHRCERLTEALMFIAEHMGEGEEHDDDEEMAGLLPETWEGDIAFAEATGDGRDFSNVAWSWRDPAVSLLPLMFQSTTDMGHFGAVLAGFIEALSDTDGTIHATGRFYDSEQGRAARDLLLDGRVFGVSVDPGEVEAEWSCVETDDEGWCMEDRIDFLAYQVIGLTMTPFPAFQNARITLAGQTAAVGTTATTASGVVLHFDSAAATTNTIAINGTWASLIDRRPPAPDAVVAAAPPRPPRSWFTRAEPEAGDEAWVRQPEGHMGVPVTITDDGQVFGHAALWATCHVGYPEECVTPPHTASAYAHFHTGAVVCDDGTVVACGPLTASTDHAGLRLLAPNARDHYANTGLAWADVVATETPTGIWVAGALRPDVPDDLYRTLRASSLSGDWRLIGNNLEMVAVLSVNTPGFPISRVASLGDPSPRYGFAASASGGQRITALVASGVVRRECGECGQTAADRRLEARLDALERHLASHDRSIRTLARLNRPAFEGEARAIRERIG